METIISARHHLSLDDNTREFIHHTADRIAFKYHKLTTLRVILDLQKAWFTAEIVLHGKHINIEAHATATDLIAAIDQAMTKASTQLTRHLDKVKSRNDYMSVSDVELSMNEGVAEA